MTHFTKWTLDEVYSRCDEVGECRIWRGGCNTFGNPHARINGKTGSLRQLVYVTLLGGPAGRKVAPKCRNPRCLSEHCLVGRTQQQQVKMAYAAKMENDPSFRLLLQRRGRAKLTRDQVQEIRASSLAPRELAGIHGVHVRTVQAVIAMQRWKPLSAATSVFNLGERA